MSHQRATKRFLCLAFAIGLVGALGGIYAASVDDPDGRVGRVVHLNSSPLLHSDTSTPPADGQTQALTAACTSRPDRNYEILSTDCTLRDSIESTRAPPTPRRIPPL